MIMEQRGMDQLGVYSVLARKLLIGSMGNSLIVPEFTGSHAIFGDGTAGFIEIYSSGTLTFSKKTVVDVFVLGSGLRGATGTAIGSGDTYTGSGTATGGKGGSGAVGSVATAVDIAPGSYSIVVGADCASTSTANASSALGITANTVRANGGTGVYATASWEKYNYVSGSSKAGTAGTNGSSIPFGVSSGDLYKLLGAGGGGGGGRAAGFEYKAGYAGGTLGGGHGGEYASQTQTDCTPGTANTGSGGGGGGAASYGASNLYKFTGGNGGSGLVIVRWGDWSDAA